MKIDPTEREELDALDAAREADRAHRERWPMDDWETHGDDGEGDE